MGDSEYYSRAATMSNTFPAFSSSMNRDIRRLLSSFEIVYLLRSYEFFSKRRASAPSLALDEVEINPLTQAQALNIQDEKMRISCIDEFTSMLSALLLSPDVDDQWSILRKLNMSRRDDFFSRMENFTSSQALSQPDEDTKSTLINMLNMLSWCKFNPLMKASTSTSPSTSTMAPDSTSHWFVIQEKDKWSLKTTVMELFDKALIASGFKEDCSTIWVHEYGEFVCHNVLTIWPTIRKSKSLNCNSYPNIEGPKDVGEKIKNGLVKLNSPMILGEPSVYGVGFVTFKLSGFWVVQKIHNMLRDGIETWVPRQQFAIKRILVNSPSWDDSNLMPIDVLRRQFIIMSQMNMLDYVKSVATTSSGNGMSFPPGELDLDEHFKIVDEGGEVRIYPKDEGNMKPILRGKSREKSGLDATLSDSGCLGYPLEDLAALWHGLLKENADFILCVTPTQQQGYVEECFDAAEHAGWTTDSFWPLASYVGFKTCSTSLEYLLSFLYSAPYPPPWDKDAKVLGYSDEAVLDCALTYTFLKYHRLADCNFSYKEMLDVEGDTFIHLLKTQAQIRAITDSYREDIDELKKTSELRLDDVWSVGVERELGLRLLMFTDLINESYAAVFPHLLCQYLYDLSMKFWSFYELYTILGFKPKTRLLLCEATAIVMEKGFHLLGITQKPSIKAVTAALVLSYVAPPHIPSPLKNPNIRTRFELFTTYLHVTRDREFEYGELFGWIQVSDYYGLLPDRCVRMRHPGPAEVSLFSRHLVKIRNNGRLEIGNPSSLHSVPFSSWMDLNIRLYATNESKDDLFEVCAFEDEIDFSSFLDDESANCSARFLEVGGGDGYIRMHYVLLRDALDSTIEVKLDGVSSLNVCGTIVAYYRDLDCVDEDFVKSCYHAVLLESSKALEDGVVSLTRSRLAIPNKGSLVIEAHLNDCDSGVEILRGSCEFTPLCVGISKKDIKVSCSTLEVTISCS